MLKPDDTPRDLLLGLLALQNGMVSRDQVVAAFGVWMTEAEPLLVAAVRAAERAPLQRRREAIDRLITLYEAWNKPLEASRWRIQRLDLDFPADPFAKRKKPPGPVTFGRMPRLR